MPERGFTLVELMLVMMLLGLLLGLGVLGVQQMDPGASGLREAVVSFVATSRDRARSSGRPVVLEVEPGDPGTAAPSRLVRRVYRRVREATFEPELQGLEGLSLAGAAVLGLPGRCGGCLDLREGGGAVSGGRGGVLRFSSGLSLDLDLLVEDLRPADIVDWVDVLRLSLDGGGALRAEVQVLVEEQRLGVSVESPAGVLLPGRWQHLRLAAADGVLALAVDGVEVARTALSGRIADARSAPLLGDAEGRLVGLMDEVEIWSRATEAGPEFGEDVLVALEPARVFFDRQGLLDVSRHEQPPRLEILDHGVSAGSFVIGRFAEEEVGE